MTNFTQQAREELINDSGCQDCPFNAESQGVDVGCLPAPGEIVEMYAKGHGKWACHSDSTRICKGLEHYLDKLNDTMCMDPFVHSNASSE